MSNQRTHRRILQILFLFLALAFLAFPSQVRALEEAEVPPLGEFIAQVANGEADVLRGIYVPNVFAFPVVLQPEHQPAFVSSQKDTLTQFGLASQYDTTGLLAHNYLAGKRFSILDEGQLIYLVFGDGRIETYVIAQSMRFQALTPDSVTSNFIDLDNGDFLSASQLFSRIYTEPGNVILQTCIYAQGSSSWGRLFIIAEPYPLMFD